MAGGTENNLPPSENASHEKTNHGFQVFAPKLIFQSYLFTDLLYSTYI